MVGLNFSSIEWFRIVLDEAHYMKDPKTNRSISLLGLKAQRRLCLSGTPLQNQLGDLHNLIKFLQIEPWTNNSIWKQCVEGPVQLGNPQGILTLQSIMKGISMRRLKTTVLDLPEKCEITVYLELEKPWNIRYQKNHAAFAEQFGKNRLSVQGWDSSHFFGELVNLRQLCNHPALIEKEKGTGGYFWNQSSKIVHLLKDLSLFLASGNQARAVIFSEFKRFLQIIEIALNERGIQFTTHYGKMDNDTRRKNLEYFRRDVSCKVLLATIKTAGVGIDLRCAHKVYLMEPTWNPAVEEQAIDRLYRIGQKERVQVVRYCIKNSIEGHIFQIKWKKAELAMLSVPLCGNLEFELVKKLMMEKICEN
ncbi:uncharacterized protein PGTG_01561 [Puccinia graminis f. sp. tritici CRL 75-36-700-3]|uniref:Uncharacterized protein n=1 Tax=Puccinia graminis f. sp. tritici (strain CRL 75-36-700-3 / race SCCL) TaxID=418459 RepID=E3JSJ5_PUCGT|nr:uncharacterized protein PGTG_01561 [Puccinia graminis f. sp. tritici CRL 75-36-700-3]EFP74968.2 hypothetical protein PGTG_01561 [Puccinia graminis f. sp. tritici CRL 75-36-700-3]